MAGTKEEDLLGWLEREEQSLGMDAIVRASTDIDYARLLLQEELGYTPTDDQLDAFMSTAGMKYEDLPNAGISFELVDRAWGSQAVYRDLETGRFISREEVRERMGW
jgi:hypothetical protein